MDRKKDIITILFAASAIISLVLVTFEVSNYVEFYKAIEQFQIQLEGVTIDSTKIDSAQVLVKLEFKVINPTGFIGLEIASITCHLRYVKDGELQTLSGMSKTLSPPMQVNPSQGETLEVDFDLKYSGYEKLVRDFIGYLQTNPATVDWVITGQTTVRAFRNTFPILIGPFERSTSLS